VLDLGYLGMVPGMTVMAQGDENELRRMLATAVAHEGGPIAFRYPRSAAWGLAERAPLEALPLGRSRVLREGSGPQLWALGSMLAPCAEATALLAARGLDPALVDARFLAPLDAVALGRLTEPGDLLVTVEENGPVGGFGEAVLRFYRERGQGPRVLCLSLPASFTPQGKRETLLAAAGLDGPSIAAQVQAAWLGDRLFADRRAGGRPL